jgi:hypothetical protein
MNRRNPEQVYNQEQEEGAVTETRNIDKFWMQNSGLFIGRFK